MGRESDLATLRDRIARPGVTVLTGRPQIGKSTLLRHLRDRLRVEGNGFVGFHRANATEATLLYAAADLYEHMLKESRWRDQFKLLVKQHDPGLPTRVGRALGEVLAEATPSVVKAAFQKAFASLQAADDLLRTAGGRTSLDPLAVDEARALVDLVGLVAPDRPMTLIIDQWEDSTQLAHEATIIRSYLQELSAWPPGLHIILHLRHPADEQDHAGAVAAWQHVQAFRKLSEACRECSLKPIDFAHDLTARSSLIGWLHAQFPFTIKLSEVDLIGQVDGNPGVLKRWIEGQPQNQGDLQELARRAHEYLYPEVESEFRRLLNAWKPFDGDGASLDVALRLALLPIPDEAAWKATRESVLGGALPAVLDELISRRLLEVTDGIPSFGLPKRREAAFSVAMEERFRPHTRRALESAVLLLAGRFVSLEDPASIIFALTLDALNPLDHDLRFGPVASAALISAKTLVGHRTLGDEQLCVLRGVQTRPLPAGTRRLLAMGLFNMLFHAREEGDLTRRDGLLGELRALHAAHREDPAVREQLAMGFFNTLFHAREEGDLTRRDGLLGELRALHAAHREDPAVREQLAMGLFNTLNDAREEGDLTRRDGLLGELRALHAAHREDPAVRERLAKGFFNTLYHAGEEGDLTRRDGLLEELRTLHDTDSSSSDASTLGALLLGLMATAQQRHAEGDEEAVNSLVQEAHSKLPAAIELARTTQHAWLIQALKVVTGSDDPLQ